MDDPIRNVHDRRPFHFPAPSLNHSAVTAPPAVLARLARGPWWRRWLHCLSLPLTGQHTIPAARRVFLALLLSPVLSATLAAPAAAQVVSAGDGDLPRLSFAERRVDVAESDNPGATTDAVLTVQLSEKSDKPVTFEYALSGKATAGEDYEAPQSTSVTIPLGSTSADLVFKVKDDPRHETLETIFVTLTDPVNALAPAPGNRAVVLISSDDGPPVLSVETSSVVEPPPGYGRYMPFALTLAPASGLDVFVDVADTMTGTASNVHTCYGYCEDYVTGRSRVRFAPGETYKVVHLGVLSDDRDEEDETIVVRLSAASKQVTFAEGTLSGTRWVLEVAGTIEDDDTRGIEVTPASLALAEPAAAGAYKVSLTSQPTHIVALDLSSGDPAVATVSPARLTFTPVNWDKPRTVTVTAVDDDDAGGTRTATVSHTVDAGTSDYGTVTVPDVTVTVTDDDPALPPPTVSDCVSDELMATAERLYERNRHRPPHYAENWFSVLVAFGARSPEQWTADGRTISPMTSASARSRGWRRFAAALECLEGTAPVVPVVSIAGGSAVTEGGDATFTLSASPAPSTAIAVAVEVADSGDFATDGQTGVRTVTVGTDGTGSFAVPTVNDGADEANGIIAAVVRSGAGYAPHDSDRWASVALTDDDDPPPAEPVVSIAAGAAVTEGGEATFTLSASPAPSAPLEVGVTVAASGAFGVSTGARTVTVPVSGSATFTVATVDDAADEPDGSVTATVAAGDGYAPHGSDGEAEVAVRDDDEPAPDVSISAGSGVTEGGAATFTLSATPAPVSDLAVTVDIGASGGAVAPSALGERTMTLPGGTGSKTFTVSTVGDDMDGPGGAVTATVVVKDGYTPGDAASATVSVADDDATGVTLSAPSGDLPEAAGRKVLTVALGRPLAAGERLTVPLRFGGTADLGSDYALAAPETTPTGVTYANLTGPDTPALTFTGPSASSATVLLTATADTTAEGSGETVTVGLGTLAATGLDGGAQGSGTVNFAILEPPPEVSIAAKAASVVEGGDAVFTVTASRASDADLTVNLAVSESGGGDFVAAEQEGAATMTIPKGETDATVTVLTVNDTADEPDGTVTVTLAEDGQAGRRYTVAASPGDAATVTVTDDDAASTGPALSVDDATAHESERLMRFTVRLSKAAGQPVTVSFGTRHSSPVSAREYQDYLELDTSVSFGPKETEKEALVYIFDDSHDEDPETFEVVLARARGAAIADGVAVGTIVNSDPMPAAWLSRFGRTVAQQALDGIAGRLAAARTPGASGTLAGQAFAFAPGSPGGTGATNTSGVGVRANSAVGGLPGNGMLAGLARAFGTMNAPGPLSGFGAPGSGRGQAVGDRTPGFGNAGFANDRGYAQPLTVQDVLLGSSFTVTGKPDGTGGSLAFWGRAAQARFDGREGRFGLDGEATTALLGADYARGRWLVGLALTQSTGPGGYTDRDPGTEACPSDMDEQTQALVCDGAVRAGAGTVDASLTAAVPYVAFQATERLRLWGAGGYGTGEVTLTPTLGGVLKADLDWTMAATGMQGDLLPPPAQGTGPALAVISDALWARTTSEQTAELAASDSAVTRLRLGLRGSWRLALDEDAGPGTGASLTPKLEIGARHDGGDAETGFGVELGGGVVWVDPALGLSLDLTGRTLLTHEDQDFADQGVAAAFSFDPDPATPRGPSLTLRQDWGGRAQGGLEALFAPDPLMTRPGGAQPSRWALEAAYGVPVFGGRFTGSPQVGLGFAGTARDYTLGWRLTPEATSPPALSFGLQAGRRESARAQPEHTVGLEVSAQW